MEKGLSARPYDRDVISLLAKMNENATILSQLNTS